MTTPSLPNSDLEAQHQSLTLPFPEIIVGLVGVIGKKLTAFVTSTKDTGTIDRWISGVPPCDETAQRLRLAYHLAMVLRLHDKPEVVQAWLLGINPDIGNRVAIRMLKDDRLDLAGPVLLAAARAFTAGG